MRKISALVGEVAWLIHRVVLDRERFDVPPLPPVVGGTWGDRRLEGMWGLLRVEGPELMWEACRKPGLVPPAQLPGIDDLRNACAVLELADGRRVVSEFGCVARSGGRSGMEPGPTCEFNVWHTEGGRACVRWVGRMKGGGFMNKNLSVVAGTRFSSKHMRLEGNYTWYLLDVEREGEELVVVVDAGRPLDRTLLGIDFNALQVSLGTPLRLDVLVGLDGPGNVVGVAGVHLGGNREAKRRSRADGPVPDAVSNECWIPVFFRRLALAMAQQADVSWGVACNAYLDSVSDATIDSQYLKLHVALEAFAHALLKQQAKLPTRLLVKDRDLWVKWVKDHAPELRLMLAENASETVFVNKVTTAMNLPSSGVVADALGHLTPPLVVGENVLDELGLRNPSVHNFVMNKPGVDYDVDRDVGRIDMLRSLFVALMARACGYDGAITGWDTTNDAAWKSQPAWWPAPSDGASQEARVVYLCERTIPKPSDPKRRRPSLLRKRGRAGRSARSGR